MEAGINKFVIDYLVERMAANAGGAQDAAARLEFPEHVFDYLSPDRSRVAEQAVESMHVNGCAVVRNFMPRAEVTRLKTALTDFLADSDIVRCIERRSDLKADDFLLNCTDELLPGGRKASVFDVSQMGIPVVYVRCGENPPFGDDGLVDIFQPDLLFKDCSDIFQNEERRQFIACVLGRASERPYFHRLFNLYVNRSVTRTRGYHSDGFGPKSKTFVYLEDVTRDDDGPYCYGRGTHQHTVLRRLNTEINHRFHSEDKDTNFSYWNTDREVKFLGRAGDLVMTFQRGAHRGWPQGSGHERLALVDTYLPEGFDP